MNASHRQRSGGAFAQVAHPHGDLGGQRAGHRLTQRDAVEEVAPIDPPALFHEVALHVAHGGDRTPEAGSAQSQEIAQHPAKPHLMRRLGRGTGWRVSMVWGRPRLTHGSIVTMVA